MNKILTFGKAIQLSLFGFGLLILFHLSIIVGIIFFDYVPLEFLWGGHMETAKELLKLELSLVFFGFFLMD